MDGDPAKITRPYGIQLPEYAWDLVGRDHHPACGYNVIEFQTCRCDLLVEIDQLRAVLESMGVSGAPRDITQGTEEPG